MDKIINILRNIRPGVDWESKTDLVGSGFLDSFDMITLVNDLSDSYNVSIGLEYLEPEHFNTVEAIAALMKDLGADI